MLHRISFYRTTTPTCDAPVSYRLAWDSLSFLEIKVDGEVVISVIDGVRDMTVLLPAGINVSSDPEDTNILLLEYEDMALCDVKKVEVNAYWTEGGDFNDDFNDDFLTGYQYKYDFNNVFEVYGYDLGNNGTTVTHNPEFNIHFHVASIGDAALTIGEDAYHVPDFNWCDFNDDFATSCPCFSDFISYRKPYTDIIKVYNNVSTLVAPDELLSEVEIWYETPQGDVYFVQANGEICSRADVPIRQRRRVNWSCSITSIETRESRIERCGPGCGCNTCGGHVTHGETVKYYVTSEQDVLECESDVKVLRPIRYWYDSVTTSREACVDCQEDCESIVEQPNSVYTNIDINPLTRVWVDDVLVNLFGSVRVLYELFDISGNLITSEDFLIEIPETGIYNWDYSLTNWSYTLPEMGDFIIRTTVEYRCRDFDGDSSTDEVVIVCKHNLPIYNCNWYEVRQVGCNVYDVYNNSFENITLEISELQGDNTWKVVSETEIPFITKLTVTHENDGIYQYRVVRGSQQFFYIVINYCSLRECILNLIQDSICRQPVGKCKEENYFKYNRLTIHAFTFFSMLNEIYAFNYLLTAIDPNLLNKLYDIRTFSDRMRLYCDDCPEDPECGCGCGNKSNNKTKEERKCS